MRKYADYFEDLLVYSLGIIAIVLPIWLVYKVFAGIFYLLNKLIDKL